MGVSRRRFAPPQPAGHYAGSRSRPSAAWIATAAAPRAHDTNPGVVDVHVDGRRLGVAVLGERREREVADDVPQPDALARQHDRVDHGDVGDARHHAAERAPGGGR